jgi:uncharacterized RDD family membrane protein YckC
MINNQLPTITPTENAKARYALAKASNRILARVIDICIVLIFSIGFGLAIIATDKVGLKHAFELAQTWRYFLIALESSTILFLYFLLVPYLTKGRTIGLLLLKLRIYNLVPTKNFFINLLKREFFL